MINDGWTWSCDCLRPVAATSYWTKLEKVFMVGPSPNGKYKLVFFSCKSKGKIFAKDIKLEVVE